MNRYLCWLAVLGTCAVPDWASAFNGRRCSSSWQPVCAPCPPLLYAPPPCVPAYQAPIPTLSPPQIYRIPTAAAQPTPTPAVRPVPTPAVTAKDPPPASPPRLATPKPAPAPEPPVRPAAVTPKPMEPVRPAGVSEPKLTLPTLPASPGVPATPPPATPPTPSVGLPDLPKLPPEPPMPAVPSPAPAPMTETGSLIPPALPRLPESLDEKKPATTETLPPLVLPPETTSGSGTTVKSSPLTAIGRIRVRSFTATGTPATGDTRKIGFFNHTDRDLALVIEGRAVTLPARTYIHAHVPPTFRWKYADNPAETVTVPASAAGVDVLFDR